MRERERCIERERERVRERERKRDERERFCNFKIGLYQNQINGLLGAKKHTQHKG
jgi:hypothetical protein